MTTLRRSLGVLAVVIGFATPVFAQQEATAAGRIKNVSGAAFIIRNNAAIPAQLGQVVYEADARDTNGKDVPDKIKVSDLPKIAVQIVTHVADACGESKGTTKTKSGAVSGSER